MKKTPVIVIPRTLGSDSGLLVIKDTVYATYKEDGVRKRKKIGPTTWSENLLMKGRDAFYAGLRAAGATVATRSSGYNVNRAAKAKDNPDYGIMRRKPWVVKIEGKVVATCDSKKEAREARDRHLGVSY